MKEPFFKYSLHAAGWFLILFLPYFLSFKKSVQFDQLWNNPHELKNFLSWLLLIGFSYTNHLWLAPHFYLERRRMLYFGLVALGLAIILCLPEVVDLFVKGGPLKEGLPPDLPGGFPTDGPRMPKPDIVLENSHLFLLFLVSVLGSITYLTQIRLRETEQQRLETELAHLKGQIQPHFLFNTLNSIYALAIRKDDKTADTVVQLSEFLRYLIRDSRHDVVDLSRELAYIQNYIDLQRSRLRDSVDVHFSIKGHAQGQQIGPLILFSFIENAFKHGVSPDEESRIDIEVIVQETNLQLCVFNKKVTIAAQEPDAGIGMQNAQKRLQLLYPGRHVLHIREEGMGFFVDLSIELG